MSIADTPANSKSSIKRHRSTAGGHQSLFSATCCLTSSFSKMNPTILIPLLAAMAMAAPHAILPQTVAYTAQVQVPITKTVHYESRPVVTGYSSTIIKPAIATHTVASPVLPALVAAQPVVVSGDYFSFGRADAQQPDQTYPTAPALPTGQPNPPETPSTPAPPAVPAFPSQAPPPQFPTGQPAFPTLPANFPQLPTQAPQPSQPGQPGAGGSQSNPPQETGNPQFPGFPGGFPNFPSFPQFIQGVHLITEPVPVVAVQEQPAPQVIEQPAPAQVIESSPAQSDDTEVIENPEFRSAVPVQAVQTANFNTVQVGGFAPAVASYAVAPSITNYAAPPAIAYAAAPHFDQLVTKEKVLAPVRTHTHITPQVTQVQPEVTVRKVIHDVPVATPVFAAPAFAHQTYAAPALAHQTYAAIPQQVGLPW